jgi:hypothetical protein
VKILPMDGTHERVDEFARWHLDRNELMGRPGAEVLVAVLGAIGLDARRLRNCRRLAPR